MSEKPVRGDKLWRTVALVILCGLVYYFSYDQGRQAEKLRFDAFKLEAVAAAENQGREIYRLSIALLQCNPAGLAPGGSPLAKISEVPPFTKIPDAPPPAKIVDVPPMTKPAEVPLLANVPAAPSPVNAPAFPTQADTPAVPLLDNIPERLSLRINQSRILFADRLVVTLLEVNSLEGRALLRLNFLVEERILTGELKTGANFKFTLDGRNWALVLSSLTISSTNLSLVEL